MEDSRESMVGENFHVKILIKKKNLEYSKIDFFGGVYSSMNFNTSIDYFNHTTIKTQNSSITQKTPSTLLV